MTCYPFLLFFHFHSFHFDYRQLSYVFCIQYLLSIMDALDCSLENFLSYYMETTHTIDEYTTIESHVTEFSESKRI